MAVLIHCYIEYAKEHIFEPLGMDGTSHQYTDLDPANVTALFNLSGVEVPQYTSWFYPISGLFTSSADWANFMRAIIDGGEFDGVRILEQASVDEMLTMTTPSNNQIAYGSNIGLVWREAAANPGWYGHTGAGSQMTHVTEIDLDTRTGYILFTNRGALDSLVGPGSTLNQTIHQWLMQGG